MARALRVDCSVLLLTTPLCHSFPLPANPTQAALNPSVYIVAHKELGMELGQAAQEAMDLRIAAVEQRMEADGKPLTGRELLSMNLFADQALALYNHFLRCYDVEAQLEEAVAPAKEPDSKAGAAAPVARKVTHSPAAPTCIRTREALIAAVAQGAIAKVRLARDAQRRRVGVASRCPSRRQAAKPGCGFTSRCRVARRRRTPKSPKLEATLEETFRSRSWELRLSTTVPLKPS